LRASSRRRNQFFLASDAVTCFMRTMYKSGWRAVKASEPCAPAGDRGNFGNLKQKAGKDEELQCDPCEDMLNSWSQPNPLLRTRNTRG
jgi:hypothetical protein